MVAERRADLLYSTKPGSPSELASVILHRRRVDYEGIKPNLLLHRKTPLERQSLVRLWVWGL